MDSIRRVFQNFDELELFWYFPLSTDSIANSYTNGFEPGAFLKFSDEIEIFWYSPLSIDFIASSYTSGFGPGRF